MIAKLFPSWIKDSKDCQRPSQPPTNERKSELYVSEASLAIEGFFTRNDIPQIAYPVEIETCREWSGAVGEDAPPKRFSLAVTPQDPYLPELTRAMVHSLTVVDVDQDGLHEVVLTASGGGYGDPVTQHATLYRYEGEHFVRKGEWVVYDGDGKKINLYFLPTAPGEMPKIIEQKK